MKAAPDAYSFELAWRWTQKTHNVLPPEVMAQIIPEVGIAEPPGVLPYGRLDPSVFVDVRETAADLSVEAVANWLRALPLESTEQITIRWDTNVAVRTTWEVFTQYWDDFCYPSSDDVEVFPDSHTWLLVYHHSELFKWGRARKA